MKSTVKSPFAIISKIHNGGGGGGGRAHYRVAVEEMLKSVKKSRKVLGKLNTRHLIHLHSDIQHEFVSQIMTPLNL